MSRKPSNRRTTLLSAAVTEIARTGTRGLRIDEVAKRAEVSPALIYHHFGDRAGLLQAALEYIADQAEGYTSAAAGTARETLIAVLVDEVQDKKVVRTNSAAWGELRGSATFDATLRPAVDAATRRWIADIADLVRRGHDDGSIRTDVDPDTTGVQLSAFVEGISGRWLVGVNTAKQARTLIAETADLVLGPPPKGRRPRS